MKLTFIGAAHEVTGSCHLLEVAGKYILIDCGMEQGGDIYENQELPVMAREIDVCLLTHAHIDHSGKIPMLVKQGFRGDIISTFATADLCEIMLRDSAHIQEFEAQWKNRKAERSGGIPYEPLYTMEDAANAIGLLRPVDYNQKIRITDNVSVRFVDVGHLLGSAAIEVYAEENDEERKIVFSGDIGNEAQPILKNPEYISSADYVVTESTYGNRNHTAEKPDYIGDFTRILKETFMKHGNVVIPSFAVGRTQELLYFIREIKERELLPEFSDFKVYVDSPLAISATKVFQKNYSSCFDDEAVSLIERGINPLVFKGLIATITSDESKEINFDSTPKVIISASGMCEAGRIRHHLKHNLWRKESTICFVGYQAQGTLGRKLIEGVDSVKLFGENVEVNARIESLKGVSGHADKTGLLKWLSGFGNTPKCVFVVHGEDTVTDEFAATIKEELKLDAFAPYTGGAVDLITGEVLSEGVKESAKVSDAKKLRNKAIFERVVDAARRLLSVVYKNEGLANKDLAKMKDQIDNLADKWDR